MRTVAEVRSYFLNHWREIVPDILVTGVRVAPGEDDSATLTVELLGVGGAVRKLVFVGSTSGEPRQVRSLLPRVRKLAAVPGRWAGMLVPHMGASGARLCREAGVGYLDCCGNAYLRFNSVLVQITGKRNKFTERKQVRTLFHDKATIPLRVLLERPSDWLTTREIAEHGDLSLGWVSQILQQMDADGYIERQKGGGSRLVRPRQLVADWLEEYSFEVNEVFPFQLRDEDVEATLQRLRTARPGVADGYALTLDSAAHALRLRDRQQRRLPFDLHVYVPELAGDLEDTLETWRKALNLRPAGHGANCFLVKPAYRHAALYGSQASHGLRAVSDLQLYIDLYHYPSDARDRALRALKPRLPFELEAS